jgi:hypothetical protein
LVERVIALIAENAKLDEGLARVAAKLGAANALLLAGPKLGLLLTTAAEATPGVV